MFNVVVSRLALNPNGSITNWEYRPDVDKSELCRLIARLDLPLEVGDIEAWEEYIECTHNPRFASL